MRSLSAHAVISQDALRHADSARVEGAATALPCLNVVSGPAAGLRVELGGEVRFGRDEPGPGALHGDPWLSSAHATVRPSPEGYFELEDLGSFEGTKVNGAAVRTPRELHFGDVIELGSSRIVVGEPNATAAAEPTAPDAPRLVPASYPRRAAALVIDVLVELIVGYFAARLFFSFVSDWGTNVVYAIVSFIVAAQLSYRFLAESLCGQTVGKRLAHIRVVRVDGKPLEPQAVMTRTILLLVEGWFFIGVITVLLTDKRRRIGDLAAGTMVVPASVRHPGFRRRDRDLLALCYPLVWCLTIAVVLRLLGPGLQSCEVAGMVPPVAKEGTCLQYGGEVTIADAGHKLAMPDYDVTLERTAVRPAGGIASRVAFQIAVTNNTGSPLAFGDGRTVTELWLPAGQDGSDAHVPQAPEAPRAFPALPASIMPGQTAHGWITYEIPRWATSALTQQTSDLVIGTKGESPPHLGEIRLWLPAGAAGLAAVKGLQG